MSRDIVWRATRFTDTRPSGYLPAEHIETPTERLARLNKHRNTDVCLQPIGKARTRAKANPDKSQLAAQMLSDTSEKSKNPLKKAMRRRNAKMVQFTAPTYYEASEPEWSDEEEDHEGNDQDAKQVAEARQTGEDDARNAAANGSTANGATGQIAANGASETIKDALVTSDASEKIDSEQVSLDANGSYHLSERLFKRFSADFHPSPDAVVVAKNGRIRNTDSFFKDDNVEPRKIILTPTMLRDQESSTGDSPRTSESQSEASAAIQETFDQLDKATSPTSDKFKDEKKKREKKPGMLSGLFKRKEKKIKVDEAAGGTVRSSKDGESLLDSLTVSPAETGNTSPREKSPQATKKPGGNKLVKSPPASSAPSNVASTTASGFSSGLSSPPNGVAKPAPLSTNAPVLHASASNQSLNGGQRGLAPVADANAANTQGLRVATGGSPTDKKEGGILSPLSNLLPQSDQPKKEKLKKAKQRIDLDVDSSPERETESPNGSSRFGSYGNSSRHDSGRGSGRAADDTVSPVEQEHSGFDSAGRRRADSPVSRSPSPTVQTPQTESEVEPKTSTAASSTVPDHHANLSNGSEYSADNQIDDEALRTYLDESALSDVRDLLIRVHDRTEVVPLPDDHPTMLELGYHTMEKRLDAMSAELDSMMHAYLARTAVRRAARRAAEGSATVAA